MCPADHQCNYDCFSNYRNAIKRAVKRKIQRHRVTDGQPRFTGCAPTITVKDAVEFLIASDGLCCHCGEQLQLHDWNFNDRMQFSFDRMDDSDTHHKHNLQVSCFGCNVKKADDQFKPNYRARVPVTESHIQSGSNNTRVTRSESAYDCYMSAKREYFDISKRPPTASRVHMQYLTDMRAHLAYLHDLVYEDRKANNWGRTRLSHRPSVAAVNEEMFS
jgi:hypothetical protein